jgi:hypothetical protein
MHPPLPWPVELSQVRRNLQWCAHYKERDEAAMAFSSPENVRSGARAFSTSAPPGNPFLMQRQPTSGAAAQGAAEDAAAQSEGGDNAATRFGLEVSSRTNHSGFIAPHATPLPHVEDSTMSKLGATWPPPRH